MESLSYALVHHPDSLGLQLLQFINILVTFKNFYDEFKGKGLRYSKFAGNKGHLLPSRLAMFLCYIPALLLCTAFLLTKLAIARQHYITAPVLIVPINPRLMIFTAAMTLHFLKRDLEALFVHKYSGSMEASSCIAIASAYALVSIQLLYAQQSSVKMQRPAIDLLPHGIVLFVVGLGGNFYHHYLQARLRPAASSSGYTKRYVVPQGGLFTLVVCPHYLFESIGFLGLAFIGQTTQAFVNALCVFISLGARSHSTKQWYLQKLEDFPRHRKAYIPFVY